MMILVHSYNLVVVVHSFLNAVSYIINLFIYLVYFYIDAEKPF